jgi:CrcB protein
VRFPLRIRFQRNTNTSGNGVCHPEWENRLTVSALITPTSEHNIRRNFMLAYLWVAIGGALGSMARYGIGGLVSDKFGGSFPWGTLVVNVTGSFVIGFLGALTAAGGKMTPPSRLLATQLLMTGVCGGYTTFSSFSLQTLNLLRDREWFYAGGNILLSVFLCMIAVWLGYVLGVALNSTKGN